MENNSFFYLPNPSEEEQWGVVCTTAGTQLILPHHEYPLRSDHPISYQFNPNVGRVLREYQIVYIADGEGWFESAHCTRTRVQAGTAILLFPNEWHTYTPDPEVGWREYWVGFKGEIADQNVAKYHFSPEEPLAYVGKDGNVELLYNAVLQHIEHERKGYQLLISMTALHLLSLVLYRRESLSLADAPYSREISRAKLLMREYVGKNITPEQIAQEVGMGYSLFRKVFRQQVGYSPNQYQLQLCYMRAKNLLMTTSMSISNIAYDLGFGSVNQFSTFFKKNEGVSPLAYRQQRISTSMDN